MHIRKSTVFLSLLLALTCAAQQGNAGGAPNASIAAVPAALAQPQRAPARDVVIRGGTIMTATHGTIQNGAILIHDGKIAAIGQTVTAPAGAEVIDASGKFVTPGIIDAHSHSALDNIRRLLPCHQWCERGVVSLAESKCDMQQFG